MDNEDIQILIDAIDAHDEAYEKQVSAMDKSDSLADVMGSSCKKKRAEIKLKLSLCAACYEKDKNPAHLWNMYKISRESDWPIPDVVLEYFDKVATCLLPTSSVKKRNDGYIKRIVLGNHSLQKAHDTCRSLKSALNKRLETATGNDWLAEKLKVSKWTIKRDLDKWPDLSGKY